MNVGLFTDCYTPARNGVVSSVLQLRRGLEARGHRVMVVTVDSPHTTGRDPAVHRFPSIPFNTELELRAGMANAKAVRALVEREKLDLIHTHTEFGLGWAGKRAAQAMALPQVHTGHTLYEAYRHYLPAGQLLPVRVVRWLLRRFVYGCDALICPSAKSRDYFQSLVPSARITVIGNGVDRYRFRSGLLTSEERNGVRQALGIRPGDRVLLYVGRLAQEKRVKPLLGVVIPLLQAQPATRLVLVGGGPDGRQLRQLAAENRVGRQVIFAGQVNWGAIHRLYAIADLFVTASLSEVHPVTLIEAALCGLPLVARRDEAYRGLIHDGTNGYLVDTDEQIGRQLAALLADDGERRRLAANSAGLADSLSSETHVTKIEALYQRVIRRPPLADGRQQGTR
jgi:1,2-diacylglycerol 3-alpha-glucosyltransferase